MTLYLDTSSLVKLYVDETGSSKIKSEVEEADVVATSKVAYAEARAAFARKQNEGGYSARSLHKIVYDFNNDWESLFVIELTDGLIRSAGDIAEKYLLRGFDSIHLASAISFKNRMKADIYFSCSDIRLNKAAEKHGLTLL